MAKTTRAFSRFFIVLAWAVFVLFIACGQDKKPEKKQETAAREVVAEVYDGDTFRMSSNKKVRIVGIDTPEDLVKAKELLKQFN